MSGRYAIYFAPDSKSEIYRRASALLGRCLYRGEKTPRPELENISEAELARHTGRASLYGFHGTIVAPFETAAPETDLTTAAARLAGKAAAFELKGLSLAAVNNAFAAIRPERMPEELKRLESLWVREFSRFRRPLDEKDISRRGPLPPKHMDNLRQWGYHLVFDEFDFHLTVADSLPEKPQAAETFLSALKTYLAPALNAPLAFDRLGLFYQPSRTESFTCRKIFLLQDGPIER